MLGLRGQRSPTFVLLMGQAERYPIERLLTGGIISAVTLPLPVNDDWTWLCTGQQVFPAMLDAIDSAQTDIRLETYIFSPALLGERFRDALVRARGRGVRVRVLVDALGSASLPGKFWDSLTQAGGEVRQFNPLALRRISIRNHRKLLVCDGRVAFIGGFNIAPEYDGDGVTAGWHDLGMRIQGPLVGPLETSFDEIFARAEFRHKRFQRWHKLGAKKRVYSPGGHILFSGPGRGANPIQQALRADLAHAKEVRMIVAYFLPPWRLRHDLARVVRRGGRVQLILAGKSDVYLAQMAGRSLYRRLLRDGVEIYEYQPQILHAKLLVVDDAVYVGSANLDHRSLQINYELSVRFHDAALAAEAREIFADSLRQCRPIVREDWARSRTLWRRLRHRWAYFLLVRMDPWVARWQWRSLPD